MINSKTKLFVGGHNAHVPLIKNTDVSYRNYLAKAGFILCDNIDQADAAIFIEMDKGKLKTLKKHIPVILIRNEPVVVWPQNYNKRLIKRVDKVIDVGQYDSKVKTFVPWPQDWTQVKNFIPTNVIRFEKIALINGNKIGFIKGELYSLRRECIYKIKNLDLYGAGWGIKPFRKFLIMSAEIVIAIKNGFFPKIKSIKYWFRHPLNFQGAPDSKFDVLQKYKYSLVIENSENYMSEKLFDAFIAGNIPIYVGPAVELFNIPSNLVIQVEPNLRSIMGGIEKAKKVNYESWKSELEIWREDPKTKEVWNSENVYPRIVQDIIKFLQEKISI